MKERPIYVEANADLIREARELKKEEMKEEQQHLIEKGAIVTFLDYKYKLHRILVYDNFHGAYVEPKVKREYSSIILKVMKFEQCFNVYTDEIEFDYMLTKDWIEKIRR